MKPLSTCVLALALLVLGTSTARAVTITEYAVTVEGEATYARADAYPAPYGQYEQRARAAFKWETRFPSVTFIDKHVGISSVASSTASVIDTETYTSVPTPKGPLTRTCTGSLLDAPPAPGWFGAGVIPNPISESLDIRVLGGIGFLLPACTGTLPGGPDTFAISSGAQEIPFGPFDDAFDMPHEAIGMGKIIQLVQANVTGSRCPGYGDNTASCALNWKATVTFVRIAQHGGGPGGGGSDTDDDLIPMPPSGDEDLIPMPPKRAKLSRNGKQAKLTLTCRVACSGSANAYAARRGAHGSAVARPLARTRFTAVAGRPTAIVLRFRPKARRAIHRARALRIELRVAPQAGGATTRRTVVLRLPRMNSARRERSRTSARNAASVSSNHYWRRHPAPHHAAAVTRGSTANASATSATSSGRST